MRERGDYQIFPAVVVEIAEIDAHGRERLAVVVEADAGRSATSRKLSVAFVVEEEVRHGVVGDEDVHPAVVVVIGDGDAHALARVCAAIPEATDTSENVPSPLL